MSPTIERHVELDAAPEAVWDAVCAPDTWLADGGTLDVRPGGRGVLRDDGIVRHVVVESVDEGRRLVYRWWSDGGNDASRVEIDVLPQDGPTRVVVRETRLAAAALPARAGLRWEVRLTCMAFLTARARV